jgi:CelD/BcsL family acetyltransferase involved in cellulose biosynthesis
LPVGWFGLIYRLIIDKHGPKLPFELPHASAEGLLFGSRHARAISRAARFRVEFVRDWKQAAARWNDISLSTPFQDPRWLDAWYAAFASFDSVEPLIAVVSDAVTCEQVALLPLVRRVQNGIRIVEFADLNLTDYNAPMLTAAAPRDAMAARVLWRDLKAALKRLPGGADLIRLRKMPADLDGRPNPLALLDGANPSPLNGNVVTTGDDFDAYRYSLERTVRKELERSWRVFTRDPAAAFRIVTDQNEALHVLSTMEIQQSARMQHLGLNFILNSETCAAFYRNLVGENLRSGYAVLSALTVGEEVVATLLGIRNGSRYVMVRISNAGEKWSNCSPGRLIIERTMAALHKDGVRSFDFSIGNYAYKRRFGVAPLALADITAALSWRGMPYALRDRAVRELRRHPRLATHVGRALGKPPSREEI